MSGECRSVNNGGCRTSVNHNDEWRMLKGEQWRLFTDVLQPPLFTLQHSPLMIVVYRCYTTAIVHASTLSTHHCGLPMFYNRHCSRFDTLHSSLWSTDVLQPPWFTLRHSPLIIVVYRCFTTAIVHPSTLSTHHCGLPMFYNRHCSRFNTLHSSLWFTDVLQPPLFTLNHSPLMSGECRNVNHGGCKTSVDHNDEWRVSKRDQWRL
jgi:hypothetical protein